MFYAVKDRTHTAPVSLRSRSRLQANRTGRESGSRLAARRNTRRDSDGGGINSHCVRIGTFDRLSCPRASL